MKTFVQDGDTLSLTAPYDVASGAGAQIGNLFGVAVAAVASGATGQFKMSGVFDLAKTTSQAWNTLGALVYWDDSGKKLTTTASTNLCVGCVVKTAGSADTVGRVRLNMGPQGIQGAPG